MPKSSPLGAPGSLIQQAQSPNPKLRNQALKFAMKHKASGSYGGPITERKHEGKRKSSSLIGGPKTEEKHEGKRKYKGMKHEGKRKGKKAKRGKRSGKK